VALLFYDSFGSMLSILALPFAQNVDALKSPKNALYGHIFNKSSI
jgi:hypothetical protein